MNRGIGAGLGHVPEQGTGSRMSGSMLIGGRVTSPFASIFLSTFLRVQDVDRSFWCGKMKNPIPGSNASLSHHHRIENCELCELVGCSK